MNKITQILIIISLISLISGCLESKEEKYFSSKYNETISLYSDNTFTSIDDTGSVSGTYRIESDKLIMTFTPFGNVNTLYFNSSGLTDIRDGDTWELIR